MMGSVGRNSHGGCRSFEEEDRERVKESVRERGRETIHVIADVAWIDPLYCPFALL